MPKTDTLKPEAIQNLKTLSEQAPFDHAYIMQECLVLDCTLDQEGIDATYRVYIYMPGSHERAIFSKNGWRYVAGINQRGYLTKSFPLDL